MRDQIYTSLRVRLVKGIISSEVCLIEDSGHAMWHARLRFVTGAEKFWPLFVESDADPAAIDEARAVKRQIIRLAKSTEPTLAMLVDREVLPFRTYVHTLLLRAGVGREAVQSHQIIARHDHLLVKITQPDLFDRKLSQARREAAVRKLVLLAEADVSPKESAEREILRTLLLRDTSKSSQRETTKPRSDATVELWVAGLGDDHDLQTVVRRIVEEVIEALRTSIPQRPAQY